MSAPIEAPAADATAHNGDIALPYIHHAATGTVAESGQSEPLLLVNGLGSPRVSYEDGFVAELNRCGFDVVRFDNRDAGQATSTEGGYFLADMANDAIAVLDAVGWDTAHVFGMSMGGMIVQQLGIDHADRLRSIVSLMSSTGNPEYGTSSKEARAALMEPAPTDRDGWLEHRVRTEQVWASPAEWTEAKSRAKGELMHDYGVQPAGVVHQYTAIMKSPPREEALRNVTVPTLVMHGTEDTLLHPSGGERTAEVMANAEYHALKGMGHDMPEAYWGPIADRVHQHVASLGD